MKYELQYAVVYSDGTWSGLFSTKKQATDQFRWAWRRQRRAGGEAPLGVFKIMKNLSVPPPVPGKAALPSVSDPGGKNG